MPEAGSENGSERLFYERGGSWLWLLVGPAAGITMLILQYTAGQGVRPVVPFVFFLIITGFLALQLKAARIHTSVELTHDILREGTEVTPVSQILEIFPEPEFDAPEEKWQTSRVLGELEGVPKRRTSIGIRLSGNRLARAWAYDHRGLREALTRIVEDRTA